MDWVQVDDKNGSLNPFGMEIPGCGKRKFLGVGRGNSCDFSAPLLPFQLLS